MSSHVAFIDAVNHIAKGAWGREFDSMEDAEQKLSSDSPRLAAYALVELLNRLNAVARAVGGKDKTNRRALVIPENAKQFPNKAVGDRLYRGDFEDGICEYIIVAKNSDGICLVVLANDFDLDYPPRVDVSCSWMHETLKEAVEDTAESDTQYHRPRLEFAEAAAKAAEEGGDLTAFANGFDDWEGRPTSETD